MKHNLTVSLLSLSLAVAAAFVLRASPEDEARELLRTDRSLLVAVADGQSLTKAVLADAASADETSEGVFTEAVGFLKGRPVVLRGSMVELGSGLFGLGSGVTAKLTIAKAGLRAVNVTCRLAESARQAFAAIGAGRAVTFRGTVGGCIGLLSAAADGCVLTLEEVTLVEDAVYERAASSLPFVGDELLGECLVLPRPFADLEGGARRELVAMLACAEAAYPDQDLPEWYRPLSREEWRTISECAGFSDDIYSDDGYLVVGNGLRGRIMVHRVLDRTVVAWSGCDLDEWSGRDALDDVKTCAVNLLGGESNAQFTLADELSNGILKTRKGTVWVVGHSLGGSITTYVALASDDAEGRLRCATFNGLGVSGTLCARLGAERCARAAKRLVNLSCSRDPAFSSRQLLSWLGVMPRLFGRCYYLVYDDLADGLFAPPVGAASEHGAKYYHGIAELRRQAEARTRTVTEEPVFRIVTCATVLLLAGSVFLIVRRKRCSRG